jgi:hypothetical protein
MTPPDILANAIAALEPFAKLVDRLDGEADDIWDALGVTVKNGEIRRAAVALASLRSLASAPADKTLLEEAWGALNFILAFYEPGQRHLDTNAWKQAEAAGRAVHAKLRAAIDTPAAPADQSDAGRDGVIEEIKRLKDSLDYRLNDYLCEMKPNYDDSITGFNEAWDIMRKKFDETFGSLKSAAPADSVAQMEAAFKARTEHDIARADVLRQKIIEDETVGRDGVIEKLIEAALSVLHHDRRDGNEVDVYERQQLRKAFSPILRALKSAAPAEESK